MVEDGGRTASAELSLPCCSQWRAHTTATNLGDVFRHGMWNSCYHHRGLCLVTGKGQVSLLHWLCLGGWRKKPCPCAVAAWVPPPGNKVWVSGTEFQRKEIIMLILWFGVRTFTFDHKCSNSLEFKGLHTAPLSLISCTALQCLAASLSQILKSIFSFNWVVAISNSRTHLLRSHYKSPNPCIYT